MRELAYVSEIVNLQPIKDTDRIETATVRGWKVVVKKGEFQVGDKCVYFEIDSLLPFKEWSEFLRNKDKPNKPIRLKTIRLRKQISQGLALTLNTLNIEEDILLDTDLTERLDIEKYVAEIPACLSGEVVGHFPSFIPKTDEERCQNLVQEIKEMQGRPFYLTEKLNGSSGTFYNYNKKFGVCSRNWELRKTEKNTFWEMVSKYNLEQVLNDTGLAIQGEVIGNGIQKNPYNITGHQLHIFTIYDIINNRRFTINEMVDFCEKNNLDIVPVLNINWKIKGSIQNLLDMAEGKSLLHEKAQREGIILRAMDDSTISFKIISNKYLL